MFALFALTFGCAVHVIGLVHPEDGTTVLETLEGERYVLAATGDARPLGYLNGHEAEIRGTRLLGAVRIRSWKVTDGLHGMPTWVGVLQTHGMMLGLQDQNSGAFYLVDPDAARELLPYVGLPVLIEGYVEGAHRVRVIYYRILAGEGEAK
jgi:hypothetical protein